MEVKGKIIKVKERIAKKRLTIEKKEKWLLSDSKDEYEKEWLRDDIRRLILEIEEAKKTIEKYEGQLSGEIEREKILFDIPVSMKSLQNELVERWNNYDFERRKKLKEKYEEMNFQNVIKKFKRSEYDFMLLSDDQINKSNMRDAKNLIIDLFQRIKSITGEVIDWSNIQYSGGALNGIVVGKEGKVKVETIIAGGYNIQKLHIRVLVHEIY